MSKKYTTNFLEDTNGSTGSANQVLVSTAAGIDWVDGSGSGIIGGPYLPLSAGSSYPLTGKLYAQDDIYISGEHVVKNIDTNLYLDSASGHNVLLRPGGSEKMRIASSGNVGIGTTNPVSTLQVNNNSATLGGEIKITNNLSTALIGQQASISLGREFEDRSIRLTSVSTGAYGINPDLVITANQNMTGTSHSELIRIKNNGNVGIGTTSPTEKLDVYSTGINYVARFRHSAGTGYAPGSILLEAGRDASRGQGVYHYNNLADENWFTGVPYNVNSKKWIVANKYSTIQSVDTAQLTHALMTIDSDTGNVGIGTTSPGEKLEVSGNVKADTLIATDLTDGVIPYHRNDSNGLQDQKMFSDSTNVYIGPASPPNYYSRLTVEGSGIYTTDIEIAGSLTYQEPTAASEFNGEIVTFGTFIETPAAGDLICFNNSLGTSGWREANNSTTLDATGMLGIAVGTTPTNGILIRGFAKSALYNTSNLGTTPAGKKLYIDSVNGLLTTVIPTSNNVRIVGYVVEADATNGTIYFCPDNTYVEIA